MIVFFLLFCVVKFEKALEGAKDEAEESFVGKIPYIGVIVVVTIIKALNGKLFLITFLFQNFSH